MMGLALQLLLGAIVPMLAYWAGWDAGWRARGRQGLPKGSYGLPPRYRPGYNSINYPDPSPDRRPTNPFNGERITLTESPIQRGNRSGGPTTPKPEFPPPRRIREDFLP